MLLPSALDCIQVSGDNGSTTSAYFALALSQIATALQTAGTYSCTLTTSGKQGADVMAVMQALHALGYRLTVSSNTITIKWDNSAPADPNNY